jgi:hypothetical protein
MMSLVKMNDVSTESLSREVDGKACRRRQCDLYGKEVQRYQPPDEIGSKILKIVRA